MRKRKRRRINYKKLVIFGFAYFITIYSVFTVLKKVEKFEEYVENTNYSEYDNANKAKVIRSYRMTKDGRMLDALRRDI